jgi:hypothetical protein
MGSIAGLGPLGFLRRPATGPGFGEIYPPQGAHHPTHPYPALQGLGGFTFHLEGNGAAAGAT